MQQRFALDVARALHVLGAAAVPVRTGPGEWCVECQLGQRFATLWQARDWELRGWVTHHGVAVRTIPVLHLPADVTPEELAVLIATTREQRRALELHPAA